MLNNGKIYIKLQTLYHSPLKKKSIIFHCFKEESVLIRLKKNGFLKRILTIIAGLVGPVPLTLQNEASLASSGLGHWHLTSSSSKHARIPVLPHSTVTLTLSLLRRCPSTIEAPSDFSNSRNLKPIDCSRLASKGTSGFSCGFDKTTLIYHQNERLIE